MLYIYIYIYIYHHYPYNSDGLFSSKFKMVDPNIEILGMIRHDLKFGFSGSEDAHKIWEVKWNETVSHNTTPN